MGSNFWLKATSAVGLAVAMLGPVSASSADSLGGVKAHIDIPEIAHSGSGKSNPNGDGRFSGLEDEFGDVIIETPVWIDPDERPSMVVVRDDADPAILSSSVSRLIVTAPQGVLNPIGLDAGVRSVPGPATLVPLSILAIGFGRRRRG